MNHIEMTFVTSSTVESIGYDPDAQELHVTFLKGGHYIYSTVPEVLFQEFLNAPSKGTFLDQQVKKQAFRIDVHEQSEPLLGFPGG